MINDINYLAGLFDGEGSVSYKQYMRKRTHHEKAYPTWQIRLEIAMTDEKVLNWVRDTFNVGTTGERKVRPGRKRQWRWRCSHRGAYEMSKMLVEHCKVKKDKLQMIVDHYEKIRKVRIPRV